MVDKDKLKKMNNIEKQTQEEKIKELFQACEQAESVQERNQRLVPLVEELKLYKVKYRHGYVVRYVGEHTKDDKN